MKKLFKLHLAVAALAVVSFLSCEEEATKPDNEVNAFEAEYTQSTPEQSKKDVENAGIELVNKIDLLEDEEAINVMLEMINLMGGEEEAPAGQFNILAQVTQVLSNESQSTVEIYNLLKAASEQGLALSDSFAAQTATYTYDPNIQDFKKSENADAIVILFPGKENDPTNTAEIRIGDFEVKEITSPFAETGLTYLEVPTNLNATLKYNDAQIMSYNLTASYMSDGVPTNLKNTVTVGAFSFIQELTHSQFKEAGFDFSFKHNDDVLIGFGAEAIGNWSSANIEENTYTEIEFEHYEVYNYDTQQYEWHEYSYEEEKVHMEEIINSSNAYIKFMNLKAIGQVNIKAMIDGEQAFDIAHENDRDEYGDYPDAIKKQETDNLVTLAKENAKFVLVYEDNNGLIAALEPYAVEDTETYYYNNEEYSYTDYYLDFRLVFKDESKISMETYVKEELSGFFNALNDFITKINTNYNTSLGGIDTSSAQ
ncbi:hypothetical protein E9993_22145 [Labilibacter sediminis]|nr:hypothetical protein E9993_22145 [Labilibacter sediminis]